MSERGDWRDRGPTSETLRAAVLRAKRETSRQAAQRRALAEWEAERVSVSELAGGRSAPRATPPALNPT